VKDELKKGLLKLNGALIRAEKACSGAEKGKKEVKDDLHGASYRTGIGHKQYRSFGTYLLVS